MMPVVRKMPLLLVILGAAGYLYAGLFRFAAVPRLLSGDQVFFWMNGQRMLNGEHAYRDFFQFTPPGTDLCYFLAFKALGPRIWVTNLIVLMVGLGLCVLCFLVASSLTDGRMAALASFLFIVPIYGSLLNATHHWFSLSLIMLAVFCLMARRSAARIAVAGALLGLASFFTQTHAAAALAAMGIFLVWERFQQESPWRALAQREGILFLAFLAAVAAVNAHYLADVGLRQLWYFQFTHVRRYLVEGLHNPLLGLPLEPVARRTAIAVYVLAPTVYAFGWLRSLRKDPAGEVQARVALLALVGSLMLAEVLFSLNWLRFFAVSMPAAILLATGVGRTGRFRVYIAALLWIVLAFVAVNQIRTLRSQPLIVEKLPGGTAAVSAQTNELLSWIAERTRPGEFFFQAAWPGFYVPLDVRNPVFLDLISTYQQTRPDYIERAVEELENKRVRYILWSAYTDDTDRPIFHLAPLREYLQRKYQLAHVFSDGDKILERK